MNLNATGAGDQSNINIIGSDVIGQQGTQLVAQNNVNIQAAQQTRTEESKNESMGWNAGVAVSYGSDGLAFGVTAGGNAVKAKEMEQKPAMRIAMSVQKIVRPSSRVAIQQILSGGKCKAKAYKSMPKN